MSTNLGWSENSTSDMELARRCGMRFMLVRTGLAGRDGKYAGRPDFVAVDLPAALTFILDAWPPLSARARDLARVLRPGQVVVIGGLARSGKSSIASELKYALRERSIPSVIAPLDNWLLPEWARGPGVLGRYDMVGLESAMTNLIVDRATVATPRYDPLTRGSVANAEPIAASPDDVVIIDGIPSLLSEKLLGMSSLRIFVECDEGERRRRFEREYAWRGLHTIDIESVYETRNQDETPLVRAYAKNADLILQIGAA